MKRFFTSCFGLGLMPIAPGTWGSVLPVILYMVIAYLAANAAVSVAVMAVVVVFFSFACVKFAPVVIEKTGKKDPGEIVADEAAGQAITLIMVSLLNPGFEFICVTAAAAFLFFRLFDIFKPWPVCALEKLPTGWGILADDLFAGFYAGLLYWLCYSMGWLEPINNWFFAESALTPLYAGVLGTVQGLTEFLPVSSSGHLVLFEKINTSIDPESTEMLLFDIAIHLGTLGAIIIAYYKDIWELILDFFASVKRLNKPLEVYKESRSIRLIVCVLATTIVTFVLYKLFEDSFKSARRLGIVAIMWAVTATLLFITDAKKEAKKEILQFGLLTAVIIGIAQAFAILPGISRSGSTICAAILLGVNRKFAVEYSFFIAIPAILGAAVLEFGDNYELLSSGVLSAGALLTGILSSFIVGFLAIKLLVFISNKRKLKIFGVYCYILAIVVFLLYLK